MEGSQGPVYSDLDISTELSPLFETYPHDENSEGILSPHYFLMIFLIVFPPLMKLFTFDGLPSPGLVYHHTFHLIPP